MYGKSCLDKEKFQSVRCIKRDETVRTLPFSIFIEIINEFKLQVQEHIESARSVMLYGHFLIFVVFIQEKFHVLSTSGPVSSFKAVRNYHSRQIRDNPCLFRKVLNGYVV